MGERLPEQAPAPPAIPIGELIAEDTELSETDAELLTKLASFLQAGMDGDALDSAMDTAFMRPYRTAAMLADRERIPEHESPAFPVALKLAQETRRSGIAYRLTDNPNLSWKVPLSRQAITLIRRDNVFTERRDTYLQTLDGPSYRLMQSRLITCVARVAAGKELEKHPPTPALRQWQTLRHRDPRDQDTERG